MSSVNSGPIVLLNTCGLYVLLTSKKELSNTTDTVTVYKLEVQLSGLRGSDETQWRVKGRESFCGERLIGEDTVDRVRSTQRTGTRDRDLSCLIRVSCVFSWTSFPRKPKVSRFEVRGPEGFPCNQGRGVWFVQLRLGPNPTIKGPIIHLVVPRT